ncbi:hypothetical protein PCYB_005620 [Plasmodium cynomolgi strain B]|uniref:CYIR protein n=1 Tax=Plasmodium cynomolgi (strain B) TaxID=1120755 RepID=K6UNU4_PLACD|nr:hypothetical protein PCYB_005620 [Plasmodium cynomolgi strain B]GAB69813.1 hypothetical protein PCYB_005620 [Plasmodium cynomolgi strain B]
MSVNHITKRNGSDVQNSSIDQLLYTGMFYKMLETSTASVGYDKYCDSRDNPMYKNEPYRNICVTIFNYLKTKYNASNGTDKKYDDCKLLSYWAYSRLFDILHKEQYVYLAYAQLHVIWNDFIEHLPMNKRCKPIHEMVSYVEWRKRKELYEYYINYSLIKELADKYEDKCNEFYEYVKIKLICIKFLTVYVLKIIQIYAQNFYKDCEKYNPEKVLYTFKCHKK